jgi:Ca2+-binding RTX toxin-like protein
MRGTIAAVCVVIAAAAVTVPQPAHAGVPAAEIAFNGGEVVYTAAAGQANALVLTAVGVNLYRLDDVVPITSDEDDCVYPVLGDDTVMECERILSFWDVDLGDLDDSLDNQTTRPGHLNLGAGNDVVRTGGTGGSNQEVAGGDGDDLIHSGPGNDWIAAGAGTDTVSYEGRIGAVVAAVATGGAEDTYVSGVENLTGGAGGDTLTGNGSTNVLDGGTGTICLFMVCFLTSGNDTLRGGNGNDTLRGQAGSDSLFGEGGVDTLRGGADFDALDGGPGSDWCYTEAGGGTTVNCGLVVGGS